MTRVSNPGKKLADHNQLYGRTPKAQRLYVHQEDGTMGVFDSWAHYPRTGFYRLSTGVFARLDVNKMRSASEAEIRQFGRAKKTKTEVDLENA